jgi:hypothetical protein
MEPTTQSVSEGPAARPPLPALLWCWFKTGIVFVFVCWHLFFLLFRNPVDLWDEEITKWGKGHDWWERVGPGYSRAKRVTRKYQHFFGIDQDWGMFSPPMAETCPFLAARLEFADDAGQVPAGATRVLGLLASGSGQGPLLAATAVGPPRSEETILSENEPDPRAYFRLGGWRLRKLEDKLVGTAPGTLPDDDEDLPLYEQYVRWSVRRWRQAHPEDRRPLVRVLLLKRRLTFPQPGHDPATYDPPEETVLGAFSPDGRLLR